MNKSPLVGLFAAQFATFGGNLGITLDPAFWMTGVTVAVVAFMLAVAYCLKRQHDDLQRLHEELRKLRRPGR